MKFIFAILIVVMHTNVISQLPQNVAIYFSAIVLNSAVPFFFVASGYFLGKKCYGKSNVNQCVKEYCKRLAPPLLLFGFVNLCFRIIDQWVGGASLGTIIVDSAKRVLFYPPGSMWFLLACMVASVLLIPILKGKKIVLNIVIGFVLFAFALLTTSYHWVAEMMGLGPVVSTYMNIFVSARNGVFFGAPFIGIGIIIYQKSVVKEFAKKPFVSVALLIFALLILALEVFINVGRDNGEGSSLFLSQLFFIPMLFIVCAIPFKCNMKFDTVILRNLSTGLYFIHQIVLWLVKKVFMCFGWKLYPILHCGIIIVVGIAFCLINYRYKTKLGSLLR